MPILKDLLRSLIEQDSDYWTIYNLSPELWLEVKRNENSMQWTDLMDYALCKLQDDGIAINDIAQNLKTIPFSQEMRNVLMDLKSKEIPVILLSDANTFYIETILTAYDVRDCVTQIITNPAYIDEKGRLRVQRYILASDPQHNCTNPCSVNICKGKELDMLLKKYGPLEKVAYIGDDPFPRFTELALNSLFNARILIFSVVVAKITLDRLYRYAVIINPLGIDENGEAMLDILEYQSPSSANDVFYALNSYGPKGRQAYLTYLFYDVIFVLSRTVPFTVLCSYAYKKAPQAVRPGVWMPLLNTAVDLLESFLLFVLLKLFPTRVEGLELLTAYVIQLKWLTFKATLAIMFISLFVGIYYAFHSLLADSVLMEKDRKQKSNARENVQNVLHQSAARRAAAAKKDS
ncbi:hypothetical protein G6F34_011742 [Rhizopus arrhizus]|nr:hypothetical protein G6F34_011742 [Rhizopus arrhizus]